jgi:hypothetical protein
MIECRLRASDDLDAAPFERIDIIAIGHFVMRNERGRRSLIDE